MRELLAQPPVLDGAGEAAPGIHCAFKKKKKRKKKRHNKEGTSVVLVMQGFFVSETVPSFIRNKVGTVQNLALLTKHVIFSH